MLPRHRGDVATKRDVLLLRGALLRAIRVFFQEEGYLEVETPTLSRYALPEANIDPLVCSTGGLLLPSPELFMKQLMAAGHGEIFQICRCYRAGEVGSQHRPEFTMLEWYRQGADYLDLMEECERLISFIAGNLPSGARATRRGRPVDITSTFKRLSMREAFAMFAGREMAEVVASGSFDTVFAAEVEPHLPADGALFLYDYPIAAGGFSKQKGDDPLLAERFELYLGGVEVANACSEIETPEENAAAMARELAARAAGKRTRHPLPPFFAHGSLPPCAGGALGVDRLAMLFAGGEDIGAALAFDEFCPDERPEGGW